MLSDVNAYETGGAKDVFGLEERQIFWEIHYCLQNQSWSIPFEIPNHAIIRPFLCRMV